MSPDRQEGVVRPERTLESPAVDRLRWIIWGAVDALFITVVLSAGFPFASFLGTGVPGLFVGPFAMLAGGLLGFLLGTWRNHVVASESSGPAGEPTTAKPTDVDASAPPADALNPAGTDRNAPDE